VSDVFGDRVVFNDGKKTMQQEYKANDKGITLVGTPVEVVRTVTYQPVGNAAGATQESKMDRVAYINSLISNGYTEADRPFLEGQTDENLKRIKPVTNATPAAPPPVPPVTPPVANGIPQLTPEQAMALLPPDMVAVLNFGQQTLNRQRQLMVNTLKQTGRCPYSDAHLLAQSPETLEAYCRLAGVVPGQGGAPAPGGGAPAGIYANGYQPGWMGQQVFGGMPQQHGASYLLNAGGPPANPGGEQADDEPLDYPVINGQANVKKTA
jgi:hypothetical protein